MAKTKDIREYTYQNVKGLSSKKPCAERTKENYQAVRDRHVHGRWRDFPEPRVQNAVCEWWFSLQDEFLSIERGVYYTSNSKDLTGCEADRQIDLFVKPNNEELSKGVHDQERGREWCSQTAQKE